LTAQEGGTRLSAEFHPWRYLEAELIGPIARQYGRKAGLARHWWFLWRYRLGLLPGFRAVDWSRVHRLVFVCQGNICRSPYAEASARAAGLCTSSFGLRATPGDQANPTLRRLAQYDLSEHRARDRSAVAITGQDLLLGMEPWHGWALRGSGAQVTLLGLWGTHLRPHLEDPFGLSDDYFRTCMRVIDDAVRHLARIIRENRGPGSG
jgi:protein-tyrosine phosphatase